MTFTEALASLKQLYKQLMFPPPSYLPGGGQINRTGWTMSEIDQMDVHFFNDLMSDQQIPEEEVYLNDIL